MKKLLLLPFFLLLAVTSFARTANQELFDSNDNEMSIQLAELTTVETYVNSNPGVSLNEIKDANVPLNINANLLNNIALSSGGDKALGIPSFLWGCVFGVAGVAVVYFVTDDRDETKKALWGCVASTVVFTVLYFTVFAVAATSAAAASSAYSY